MSMSYCFDESINRRHTGSLKWDKYKDPKVLPLWVADMDFRSPPEVLNALQERLDHGVFGYTMPDDDTNAVVLNYLKQRHGLEMEPESIVWLPGLVSALNLITRAFAAPGEGVLTAIPVYPPFLNAPKQHQRECIPVPLQHNGSNWGFDWEAMEAAVTPATKVFFLCSPHNPVGQVFDEEELNRVLAFCDRHDLILCSDEIHCDLLLDEDVVFKPTLQLEGAGERTIALYAPSKTYNLPGLSCAFAVIPDRQIRSRLKKEMAGIITEINAFGLVGCKAAYRYGEPWRQQLIRYLRGNRNYLYEACASLSPRLKLFPVQATYLAWFDVREWEVDSPVEYLEKRGLGLTDGAPFGSPGFLRLNFGCPRATLEKAVAILQQASIGGR